KVCEVLALVLAGTAFVHAQEPSSGSVKRTNDGVYCGGQFGALGGSSLWSPYDLVDGSGSHFGGFSFGSLQRRPSGLAFGGEVDLSFGAEPRGHTVSTETPQVFGTARARIGYGPKRSLAYGTGGLAWTRDQLTRDPAPSETVPSALFFRQHIG